MDSSEDFVLVGDGNSATTHPIPSGSRSFPPGLSYPFHAPPHRPAIGPSLYADFATYSQPHPFPYPPAPATYHPYPKYSIPPHPAPSCPSDHPPLFSHPTPFSWWTEHSSGQFANSPHFIQHKIRSCHPEAICIATSDYSIDLLSFASDPENATCVPNTKETPEPYIEWEYISPSRRIEGSLGQLGAAVKWGRYDYTYKGDEFILYVIEYKADYIITRLQFVLHHPPKSEGSSGPERSHSKIKALLRHAGAWNQQLRSEIWVYDRGFWQKDAALFASMAKAKWSDVILPKKLKDGLRGDVLGFFSNRHTYDGLGVAWKRGIILYGPPGNGKTVSLKAMMNELYFNPPSEKDGGSPGEGKRPEPIPTLYVRSFMSWGGDEIGINIIFTKAREMAPCFLIMEDLDSLITFSNRSYFLNQMDGLDDNNGIFVVGTTNHLERLDEGIVGRPSRFDRKYEFGLPGVGGGEDGGRKEYVEYWRNKLKGREGIKFEEDLVDKIVERTEGFSFAYLKEAFVSALLLIAAGETGDGDDGADEDMFERVILKTVEELRKQIGGGDD